MRKKDSKFMEFIWIGSDVDGDTIATSKELVTNIEVHTFCLMKLFMLEADAKRLALLCAKQVEDELYKKWQQLKQWEGGNA